MPSLALLFHLADWAAGRTDYDGVSLAYARQAASCCAYLESHARRIYFGVTTPQMRAAQDLAQRIRSKHAPIKDGSFSCRDIYLKGWRGLNSPDLVKTAAEILADANWIRESPSPESSLGRPSLRWQVNPRVWK